MTRNTRPFRPARTAAIRCFPDRITGALIGLVLLALSGPMMAPAQADPVADYNAYCAECHDANRLGGIGPSLIPQTLKRMRGPTVEAVIRDGRVATQMPGFA